MGNTLNLKNYFVLIFLFVLLPRSFLSLVRNISTHIYFNIYIHSFIPFKLLQPTFKTGQRTPRIVNGEPVERNDWVVRFNIS